MSISSIGSSLSSYLGKTLTTTNTASSTGTGTNSLAATQSSSTEEKSPFDQLMEFLNKNPIEIMEERWLKSHNLTQDDLDAMSPEKRDEIKKEMADYIKQQLEEKAQASSGSIANILV